MPVEKIIKRKKKKWAIRKKIQGTTARPRLAVYKSNKALYLQLIDDSMHHTLAAADTRALKLKNCASASEIGKLMAKNAKQKNISIVVFD